MSPADSGSPRAAHRQERLQGPSSVPEPVHPEPVLPGAEQQAHVPQAAPTPLNGLLVLPDNALPRELSVPLVPRASARCSPANVRRAPLPSVQRRVGPDW